jgi:hypothetical protein
MEGTVELAEGKGTVRWTAARQKSVTRDRSSGAT